MRAKVAQLEKASSQYGQHCAAAREIAYEYFDSKRVLAELVERAMGSQLVPANPVAR